MHHQPRETRRRYRSCPPSLKLYRGPGPQPRWRTMESHHSTGQLNPADSRRRADPHACHNAPASRVPVETPGGTSQNPPANNGLPCSRSSSRAQPRSLGIGPYWNPPRTTTATSNAVVLTSWAKGPKMTDCEWMLADGAGGGGATTPAAAAAASTETIPSKVAHEGSEQEHPKPTTTSIAASCEETEWDSTPPTVHKRRRPCPREAWSSCGEDGTSFLSKRHVRMAAAVKNVLPISGAENIPALVRYHGPREHLEHIDAMARQFRRSSEGSLPLSSSPGSASASALWTPQWWDLEREFAVWDPFWVHEGSVYHE